MERKADFEKFAELFTGMHLIFGEGKELNPALIEIYFKSLERFEIDVVENAINSVAGTRIFPGLPKPAELIQAIEGTPADEAVMAFEEVRQLVVKYGYYDTVKFNYPGSAATIEHLGGWLQISSMDNEQFKWFEKDFLKIYPTMKKKGSGPDKLLGFHDQNNLVDAEKYKDRMLLNPVKSVDGLVKKFLREVN